MMRQNIIKFFQSEKVKKFNKRMFNKKTLTSVIAVIVIAVAIRIAFSFIFEVEGTVNSVNGTKITVSNFLTTQTVDIGNYPITGIQAGDRIEISKNLSGQVYAIRDNKFGHKDGNKGQRFMGNDREKNGQRSIGDGKQNFRNGHK